MTDKGHALVKFVRQRLEAVADPAKAVQMAAYMKTDMPFYGVQKPFRKPFYREMRKRYPASSHREYVDNVRRLWRLEHREEKYTAIEYALQNTQFIKPRSLSLYEQLIREGGWWDLVDTVASDLVGRVLLDHRTDMRGLMENWVEDEDLWIRRTAILAQLRHKAQTDAAQLFDFCRRRAHERQFFIRKAIGWALREYSKTAPTRVRDFLMRHRQELSGLSFREGARRLVKMGLL
jgi:3-methyladenine DNA glycosylase AlkD